jgi:hypothetical protein
MLAIPAFAVKGNAGGVREKRRRIRSRSRIKIGAVCVWV